MHLLCAVALLPGNWFIETTSKASARKTNPAIHARSHVMKTKMSKVTRLCGPWLLLGL